jgi:hypothetical protein
VRLADPALQAVVLARPAAKWEVCLSPQAVVRLVGPVLLADDLAPQAVKRARPSPRAAVRAGPALRAVVLARQVAKREACP